MIKLDLTHKKPTYGQLLTRYAVKGVPTIVFLDHNGIELQDLQLVDFLPADQFRPV